MLTINVNGATRSVDVEAGIPSLRVLREHRGLTGTKMAEKVLQCGYCQSWQIMQAAVLQRVKRPTREQILHVHANFSRRGTYQGNVRAMQRSAAEMAS